MSSVGRARERDESQGFMKVAVDYLPHRAKDGVISPQRLQGEIGLESDSSWPRPWAMFFGSSA